MKLNALIRKSIVSSISQAMKHEDEETVKRINPHAKGLPQDEYFSRISECEKLRKNQAGNRRLALEKIQAALSVFSTSEELEERWPEVYAHIPEYIERPREFISVPKPIR